VPHCGCASRDSERAQAASPVVALGASAGAPHERKSAQGLMQGTSAPFELPKIVL
jgi:hypothetical protein